MSAVAHLADATVPVVPLATRAGHRCFLLEDDRAGVRKRGAEFLARADPELAEDRVQMSIAPDCEQRVGAAGAFDPAHDRPGVTGRGVQEDGRPRLPRLSSDPARQMMVQMGRNLNSFPSDPCSGSSCLGIEVPVALWLTRCQVRRDTSAAAARPSEGRRPGSDGDEGHPRRGDACG